MAQGVPVDLLPTYFYPEGEVDGVSGGNPDLDVETADTYTVGFVFEPRLEGRWLENLQVSIDWYDIKIEDAIAPVEGWRFRCALLRRAVQPRFLADELPIAVTSRGTPPPG